MKIVTVLGARPQFIKAAVLSRIFNRNGQVQEIVVHTGQHYDENMSDIFFREMEIPKPHYSLAMTAKLHGEMTGKMLQGVEEILMKESPDVVLVYGDTNSTLAGALAASKMNIPIAHVEAGLRSFNRRMPEEINRTLTDHLSNWLFAPTDNAVKNLLREGFEKNRIHMVGDVMYDAVLFYKSMASTKSNILKRLNLTEQFVLATIHRAENTNDEKRLGAIFEELVKISRNKTVVLPLHPRTKACLKKDYSNPNFRIIEPVGYFDMLQLQVNCGLIVTDSGGIQKESFFNKKFCVTIREETEWVELVENGFNDLAKPLNTLTHLVDSRWGKPFDSSCFKLFGSGSAAEEIASILIR